MSTPGNDISGSGSSTDPGAPKEKAQQAAGTAADEGSRVASVAKDEAQQVAGEVKEQASNWMGEAKSQIEEQSRTQKNHLVETLRTFTDDLEKMAAGEGGNNGMAADVARQVAQRARGATDHLQGREPADLLDEVRSFARRRPGAFLFGALAAGVIAGRVTRGAKDASSGGEGTSGAAYDDVNVGAGTPVAGGTPLAGEAAVGGPVHSTSRPTPSAVAAPTDDPLDPVKDPALGPDTDATPGAPVTPTRGDVR